jgi:hypothetical protein
MVTGEEPGAGVGGSFVAAHDAVISFTLDSQ